MKKIYKITRAALLTTLFTATAFSATAQGNGKKGENGKPTTVVGIGQGKGDTEHGKSVAGEQGVKGSAPVGVKGSATEGVKGSATEGVKGSAVEGTKGSSKTGSGDVKGGHEEIGKNGSHAEGEHGNGNAYGKNKGELEGKEFGQARAAEAKSKTEDKVKTTEDVIIRANTTQADVTTGLTNIKNEVEAGVKSKSITAAEAEATKAKLAEVEAKIKALQEAAAAHQKLVDEVKTQLTLPATAK